jgi:biotin synthase
MSDNPVMERWDLMEASEALQALRKGQFDALALKRALLFQGDDREALFQLARETRERHFPDRRVEVRSVIEISNVCQQGCQYCNMGTKRDRVPYVIEKPLLLELAQRLYEQGRRVLLLQSGENPAPPFIDFVAECIADLKKRYPDLVLILCMGNLGVEQYRQLRQTGAERYVLKFETSNEKLYERLKPYDTFRRRMACLEDLISVGFEVGTGNITGLPGQALDDLVNDLLLTTRYPLRMVSSTTFIPAEDSELKDEPIGDVDLTLNMMALLRVLNPDRWMPATSSLDKARSGGQFMGLMAGANTVTIHDGTPDELKALFPIYSMKRMTPNLAHMQEIVAKAGLAMA